jgi:hypothetical protein
MLLLLRLAVAVVGRRMSVAARQRVASDLASHLLLVAMQQLLRGSWASDHDLMMMRQV